jgi:hypothetical protein
MAPILWIYRFAGRMRVKIRHFGHLTSRLARSRRRLLRPSLHVNIGGRFFNVPGRI